jgi:hypothetical protein
MAGAAAIQAKNLFYGKDPQAMDTPKFWLQSLAQGGGLGVYGDMLNSAFTGTAARRSRRRRADRRHVEDVRRLSSSQARKLYEGKDTSFATELTRVGRRYTPGTFYTKLAVDRLLWDNLQQLTDPDYRGSFRRMEETLRKDTGQQFWWHAFLSGGPGEKR